MCVNVCVRVCLYDLHSLLCVAKLLLTLPPEVQLSSHWPTTLSDQRSSQLMNFPTVCRQTYVGVGWTTGSKLHSQIQKILYNISAYIEKALGRNFSSFSTILKIYIIKKKLWTWKKWKILKSTRIEEWRLASLFPLWKPVLFFTKTVKAERCIIWLCHWKGKNIVLIEIFQSIYQYF